jgi:hypothetical protein
MEQDYDAAVDWLESNTVAEPKRLLLEAAMRHLASAKPELVIRKMLAGEPIASGHGSLVHAINGLGRKGNDNDVLDLLDQAPDSMREEVRRALMETGRIAPTDEYLAATLSAVDGDNSITRNRALQKTIEHQPERLPEMLQQVPPEHRIWFFEKFAPKINWTDPSALLKAAADMGDPKIYASRGTQQALASIGLSNPRQAMETVEALPAGGERAVAVETVAKNLLPDDPDSALEWLEIQRGTGEFPDERYQELLASFRIFHPLHAEQIDALLERAQNQETE